MCLNSPRGRDLRPIVQRPFAFSTSSCFWWCGLSSARKRRQDFWSDIQVRMYCLGIKWVPLQSNANYVDNYFQPEHKLNYLVMGIEFKGFTLQIETKRRQRCCVDNNENHLFASSVFQELLEVVLIKNSLLCRNSCMNTGVLLQGISTVIL